ncbi:MAG: DUF4290 domain-containing protein, partial [Mucinivorans sp.]
ALVPRLARELTTIEDENARNKAAAFLARYMRQKSYDYNNEFPSNDLIINDLSTMTKGAIVLDPSVFNGAQIELRQQPKRNQPNQNRNKNRTINNRQGRNA